MVVRWRGRGTAGSGSGWRRSERWGHERPRDGAMLRAPPTSPIPHCRLGRGTPERRIASVVCVPGRTRQDRAGRLAAEILARRLRLPEPETRDLLVERDLELPMEDGAVLLADRYAPREGPQRPIVLVRSPYGRRGFFGVLHGRLLAERGFQAVVQSVRGTFGSGGEFNPFDERADGLATIAWLQRQPWFVGPIGMTGSSYLGLTQWAVAREADGALGAITPSITASQFHAQGYGGGVIALETALSWVVIVASQEGRFGLLRVLRSLRRLPGLVDQLPIEGLGAAATGREVSFYSEWMQNPAADSEYWISRDFSSDVGEVTAPTQLVGGWYDIFLPWLLQDFVALQAAGRAPQLIVGPWAHTAPGQVAKGTREAIAWLRAYLLGDRRMLDEAPVRVYVGGAREWRSLASWPPPEARPLELYLRPGGRLGPEAVADLALPTRYRYDPASPTPSLGGPVLLQREPVVDNAPLESRSDVLVFSGEPLEQELEAIGPVSVELYVRSSLDFFDVFARVCDVDPEGVSRNVCDALARVTPELFEHGEDGIARVAFELWPTAHRFGVGHRVRLQLSSGAHPRYARNPGTGEDAARATRLLVAEQEVFHDAARRSAVTLSLV